MVNLSALPFVGKAATELTAKLKLLTATIAITANTNTAIFFILFFSSLPDSCIKEIKVFLSLFSGNKLYNSSFLFIVVHSSSIKVLSRLLDVLLSNKQSPFRFTLAC